jgi:hypothetical protein
MFFGVFRVDAEAASKEMPLSPQALHRAQKEIFGFSLASAQTYR